MPSIQEIRQQYPQYQDLSDDQLAIGLHKKYYSDMPIEDFKSKIGVKTVISSSTSTNLERQKAIKNVDELGARINEFMPGKILNKQLDTVGEAASQYVPEWMSDAAYKASIPLRGAAIAADEAAKQYGSYAWGRLRGVPIAGAYLDEAIAGVGQVFGDYDEIAEHVRAFDDVVERDRGAANLAGKVAGGVSAGYAVGGHLVKGAQPILQTAGKSALAGAGIGAAHEFGEGEGLENRLDKAGDGALLGGVLGGGIPLAGAAVSKVAAPLINKYAGETVAQFGQSADEAADSILANRLGREGIRDASIYLRGGRRSAKLGPNSVAELPETIGDSSDEMQRLLGVIYRNGGKPGQKVYDALHLRQRGAGDVLSRVDIPGPKGQYKNIMGALERALNIKSEKGAFKRAGEIMSAQSQEGKGLYRDAFKNSEAFNLSDELANTVAYAKTQRGKIGKSLYKALRYFKGDKRTTPVRTLKEFDDAKKALDDDILKAKGNQKRELVAFKNRMLSRVHAFDGDGFPTKNISYQKARDAWGGHSQALEALELGKKALNVETDDIVAKFKALSPGDQKLFRVGLRDAFRKKLKTKTPGNDISKLFEQNHIREMLSEVIPQSKKISAEFGDRAMRFGNYVNRQRNMNETNTKALGGSPTVKNQMDSEGFAGDVFDAVTSGSRSVGVTSNVIAFAGNLIKKTTGMKEEVASKLAQRLLEADPLKQRQILLRLEARLGSPRYEKFVKEWDRIMVTMGLAASTN